MARYFKITRDGKTREISVDDVATFDFSDDGTLLVWLRYERGSDPPWLVDELDTIAIASQFNTPRSIER